MRNRWPACTILVAALVLSCAWQTALAIGALTGTETATPRPLFVVGVPAPLLDSVQRAIVERFGLAALDESVRADDAQALDDATGKGVRTVIALGRDACAAMMAVRPDRRTLCALLYADAFDALDCGDGCEHVEAIVMDQPPERQARVATRLFPALERFGVLRETAFASTVPGIESRTFDPRRRLSTQITDLLVFVDALIVEPRAGLYPPRNLRTVLLAAYGRDGPIIGYGPDWVRAGALVSAWSTPADVLGDVRDILGIELGADAPPPARMHPPSRFHVAENPAVARSLGLRRRPFDIEDRPFTDRDFLP